MYDQHPELLKQWAIIFEEKAKHEKREQDRRDRESKRKSRRK